MSEIIYTVGGTVQAGEGALYIARPADQQLLSICREGRLGFVLTARQVGKSSLMINTAEKLLEDGIAVVIVDLSKIGIHGITPDQWYLGVLTEIADQLELEIDLLGWWRQQPDLNASLRMVQFFEKVLLKEIPSNLVIFIDEIDSTLSLPFSDDFYGAIRSLYNSRATNKELRRLTFILIGVATPSDLIADPNRTPFNIGERVELTDFTVEEMRPFAAGFNLSSEQSEFVLNRVRDWTGGHPYLTQRLCSAISAKRRDSWTESDIDAVVAETFFTEKSNQDSNLQFVRDMLTVRAAEPIKVLEIYRKILANRRPVADEEQSVPKSHLKLSGVVRRDSLDLKTRNKIYRTVFNRQWVKEHIPVDWTRRSLIATTVLAIIIIALLVLNLTRPEQRPPATMRRLSLPIEVSEICNAVATLPAINIRSQAASASSLVGTASAGEVLEVKEMTNIQDDGFRWVGVDFRGQFAFVRSDLVSLQGNCVEFTNDDRLPAPVAATITQGFKTGHPAMDFGATIGMEIHVAIPATVIRAHSCTKCTAEQPNVIPKNDQERNQIFADPGWGFGYGNHIIVRHEFNMLPASTQQQILLNGGSQTDGVFVLYAQLYKMSVSLNEALRADTLIGYTGHTGYSTGPHLHIEVAFGQEWGTARKVHPMILFAVPNLTDGDSIASEIICQNNFFDGTSKDEIIGWANNCAEKARGTQDEFLSFLYYLQALYYYSQAEEANNLEGFPRYSSIYLGRGRVFSEMGLFESAIVVFNELLSYEPENADAYFYKGQTFLMQGNLVDALGEFRVATEFNVQNAEAFIAMAEILGRQGNSEQAAAAYIGAAKAYQASKDFEASLENYNFAFQQDPSNPAIFLGRAQIFAARLNYVDALNEYNTTIEIDPSYVEAYLGRGFVYQLQGNHDKALEDYNQAIGLDVGNALVYVRRGSVYYQQKNDRAAFSDFDRALELDPTSVLAYAGRGLIHFYRREIHAAINDLSEYRRLSGLAANGQILALLESLEANPNRIPEIPQDTSATEVLDETCQIVVSVAAANVRTSPDATSPSVGVVLRNTEFTPQGISEPDASGFRWFEVETEENQTGHIREDLVRKEGNCLELP